MFQTDKKKIKKREDRPLLRPMPASEKDPYRWVVLILFLIILFVSYTFWVQG